jgi:hypothetical protein
MLLDSPVHVLFGRFVPYLELFFDIFGAPVNARVVAFMGAVTLAYHVGARPSTKLQGPPKP